MGGVQKGQCGRKRQALLFAEGSPKLTTPLLRAPCLVLLLLQVLQEMLDMLRDHEANHHRYVEVEGWIAVVPGVANIACCSTALLPVCLHPMTTFVA